jgi:hypothetical protein
MNKISKNVYLFVIGILSVALCVSVTLNFTAKTEASVKKAEASKTLAKSDIIDDINSDFYGTIFVQASHDSGVLTLQLRKNIGGGLMINKFITIQDVDIENDVSTE